MNNCESLLSLSTSQIAIASYSSVVGLIPNIIMELFCEYHKGELPITPKPHLWTCYSLDWITGPDYWTEL